MSGINYKMDGLNKFTEYTVRVLAINRYGPGAPSETVTVTTHSDGEPGTSILNIINPKKHFLSLCHHKTHFVSVRAGSVAENEF